MKRKLLSFVAVVLLSAGLVSPVYAQTDVTSQYIQNPSFEAEEDPTTTGVSETLTGWERNYVSGYNWNGCNGDWVTDGTRSYGIWKPAIESDFELSQELTVPNGIYTLTVDMTVSRTSSASRMNGQRMFAGDMEVFYPASAETASDNGAAYVLKITTKVTDGKLKIGIRTDGGTEQGIGWFKVDNFRLYAYDGDDGYLLYCQSQLNTLSNEAEFLTEELPGGNAAQLLDMRDQIMESVAGSDVVADYEEAIDLLTAAIADMQPARESFMGLLDKINVECDELIALNYLGLADFKAAIDAVRPIFGNPEAYQEDYEEAIEKLDAAILTYRFSEFPNATAENPFDATWLVKNPDIEEGIKDWTVNGFGTINTGDNYAEFAGTFMEKWVAGPATLADYSASQTLTGIPNGTYNLSAAMIACQQSDGGIAVTGACLFGNSSIKEASTGNGIGERFELNVVVTDGTLVFGVKTVNTTANWVGFDFVKLSYLGKDISVYEAAYTEQLAQANGMIGVGLLLPKDEKVLQAVIDQVEAADRSTVEALETVLGQLSAAIETAQTDMASLKAFKAASYAKALAVAENADDTYSPDLASYMEGVISEVNTVLDADTTTVAVYPALTVELDRHLSFVNIYQECDLYAEASSSEELIRMLAKFLEEQLVIVSQDASKIEKANEILSQYLDFAKAYAACEELGINLFYDELEPMFTKILSEQLQAVTADITKIPSAKALFTSFMSFCKAYDMGMEYLVIEIGYPEELRVLLANECESQRKIVAEDFGRCFEAERRINEILGDIRSYGLTPGDEMDVTNYIVNPTIEAADKDVLPEGWEIEKSNADKNSTTGQHWSGETTDRYMDSWNGTAGALKFTAKQEIRGIPNGTYRLVAAVRSSGNGAYLFGKVVDGFSKVEIPVNYDSGGDIWKNADADTDIKNAHSGAGWGWNWLEIPAINVNTNSLTIGCSTDKEFTGGTAWAGTWFSADDFKLFWISDEYYALGVEEIGVDSASELVAYAENGVIKVEGVESYIIFTLNGIEVPANAQLVPGIYIVKSGSKTVKVAVK